MMQKGGEPRCSAQSVTIRAAHRKRGLARQKTHQPGNDALSHQSGDRSPGRHVPVHVWGDAAIVPRQAGDQAILLVQAFYKCIVDLDQRRVRVEPLITHGIALEDLVERGVEELLKPGTEAIKVLVLLGDGAGDGGPPPAQGCSVDC